MSFRKKQQHKIRQESRASYNTLRSLPTITAFTSRNHADCFTILNVFLVFSYDF